ncbi:MAG: hypothetical protein RhofKO_20140 [Rhodothermales bacterium]
MPPVETVGTIQVLDAQTGEALDQRVTIRFAGDDAAQVVDQFLFEPITQTSTETGIATFAFPDGLTYSESDPYTFVARVSAEGYLNSRVNIAIADKGRYVFEANLVKKVAPPAGVVVSDQPAGATDNSGTTQTDVTVTTNTDATTGAAATVQIPSGTQVTSASGQPLQGDITTTVVYNTVQTQEAAAAANSTTSDVTVNSSDGSSTQGAFVPVATVQISITDQNGTPATTLSQPLTVQVPVEDRAINPLTGRPFAVGDAVPVYAFDDVANTWNEVTNGRVAGKGGPAGRVVRTAVAVVVEWEITQADTEYAVGKGSETTDLTLAITGKGDEEVRVEASARQFSKTGNTAADQIVLQGVPTSLIADVNADNPFTVKVFFEKEQVGVSETPTLVANGTVEVAVAIPQTAMGRVDLDLDCSAIDPNKGAVRPSTQFQYARQKDDGTFVSPASTGDLENGVAEVQMRLGATYRASVTYKDDTYSETFTTPTTATDSRFNVEVNLTDEQIRSVCNEF